MMQVQISEVGVTLAPLL